ncbi:MAG: late competence development ComFB family protein [Spirochaetota bacterium]
MKVHNTMEEVVVNTVHEIFTEEEKTNAQGFCTCSQCRLDVACYVLNRIPPQYIISGRGLAHVQSDYQEQLQKHADLAGLINEAIKKVSRTKRPHFSHAKDKQNLIPKGPLYNFPTIIGRLFNGNNFEPISNMNVSLLSKGELVKMFDPNWQNPYPVADKTAGTFIFWPYPVKAENMKMKKVFEFELFVEAPKFEALRHFFELELEPDELFNDSFHLQKTHKIEDLYLFPL